MQAGYTRTNFGSYQINWALVTTDTKHRQLRESQLHLSCCYPSPLVSYMCPCPSPSQCHIETHRTHCRKGKCSCYLIDDRDANIDSRESDNMPVHTCHASCGTFTTFAHHKPRTLLPLVLLTLIHYQSMFMEPTRTPRSMTEPKDHG